jgi:hypothetical protein
VLGWYLSYSASRLDRLHHRVETLRAALDAQLARRAAAASRRLRCSDPATGLLVADAAPRRWRGGDPVGDGVARGRRPGPQLEEIENDLTRACHVAFGDPAEVAVLRDPAPLAAQALDLLDAGVHRVQLAGGSTTTRWRAAVRVRRKPVVRWTRLAGTRPCPRWSEIDDSVPPVLTV